MKVIKAIIILIFSVASLYCGDTTQINITVGHQKLNIKSPSKFHEISNVYPEYRKLGEMFTPPQNLFLGMFVSEADLGYIMKGKPAEQSRFMALNTLKDIKHQYISYSEFTSTKELIKRNMLTSLDKIVKETNVRLDNTGKKLSIDNGINVKVKIGDVYPLGILFESNNVLTFSVLMNVISPSSKKEAVLVAASSIIFVKGAPIISLVYSEFNSQKDIDWVEKESKKWVESILASNQ